MPANDPSLKCSKEWKGGGGVTAQDRSSSGCCCLAAGGARGGGGGMSMVAAELTRSAAMRAVSGSISSAAK